MTTNPNQLKLLAPPKKRVVSKVLYDMGWGSKTLEHWLGVSDSSIERFAKLPTPDELKTFEEEFKLALRGAEMEGLALVTTRLIEVLPKERRIDQLVKAGEYLKGSKAEVNQTNVQVNFGDFVKNV